MPTVKRESRPDPLTVPDSVSIGDESEVAPDPQLPKAIIEQSAQALDDKTWIEEMNFLKGEVEVTMALPSDPADLVMREVLYHQGVPYVFDRGVPKVVPRFVLAMMARKKKEHLRFQGFRAPTGDATNRVVRLPYTRFNHSYRSLESSPAAQARESEWYAKQLAHHF